MDRERERECVCAQADLIEHGGVLLLPKLLNLLAFGE